MDRMDSLEFVPFSCATVHAAMEAATDASCAYLAESCCPFPRDSSPSTGLYGTLHNNQLIDMAPFELDKEPDMDARSFKPYYTGYVCVCLTHILPTMQAE